MTKIKGFGKLFWGLILATWGYIVLGSILGLSLEIIPVTAGAILLILAAKDLKQHSNKFSIVSYLGIGSIVIQIISLVFSFFVPVELTMDITTLTIIDSSIYLATVILIIISIITQVLECLLMIFALLGCKEFVTKEKVAGLDTLTDKRYKHYLITSILFVAALLVSNFVIIPQYNLLNNLNSGAITQEIFDDYINILSLITVPYEVAFIFYIIRSIQAFVLIGRYTRIVYVPDDMVKDPFNTPINKDVINVDSREVETKEEVKEEAETEEDKFAIPEDNWEEDFK